MIADHYLQPMDFILSWDLWLFRWINGLNFPEPLEFLIILIRNRYLWLPVYLALITWVLTKHTSFVSSYLLLFLFSGVIIADITSSQVFKKWIERTRPCNEVGLEPHITERITCRYSYSFPSSHATNHFAIATLLYGLFGHRHRRWMMWYLWATMISLAQVYVGVHYPLDIVGGAILGVLLMRAFLALIRYIYGNHEELQVVL